jgi:hypothetical protein
MPMPRVAGEGSRQGGMKSYLTHLECSALDMGDTPKPPEGGYGRPSAAGDMKSYLTHLECSALDMGDTPKPPLKGVADALQGRET